MHLHLHLFLRVMVHFPDKQQILRATSILIHPLRGDAGFRPQVRQQYLSTFIIIVAYFTTQLQIIAYK